MESEYYERLGVSTDATTDEIQSAYRERLKQAHPDVSDSGDARERTRALIKAKEVLTDESERARYDRLGHDRYVDIEGNAQRTGTEATRRSRTNNSGSWSTDDSTSTAGHDVGTARNQTTASNDATGGTASDTQSSGRSSETRQRTTGGQRTYRRDGSRSSTTRDKTTRSDTGHPGRTGGPGTAASSEGQKNTTSSHTAKNASGATRATGAAASTGPTAAGSANRRSSRQASRNTRGNGRRTTGPNGGHSVGWYRGGDPAGSTPGSWSFGGTNATRHSWPFGGGTAGRYGEDAPFVIPPNRVLSPAQTVLILCLSFVTYPMFVYGAVFPMYSPGLRVLFATTLIFTIAFFIVMAQLGVAIAGSWTVLFPITLFLLDVPLLSVHGGIAFSIIAFTLGLTLASRALLRTPPG